MDRKKSIKASIEVSSQYDLPYKSYGLPFIMYNKRSLSLTTGALG